MSLTLRRCAKDWHRSGWRKERQRDHGHVVRRCRVWPVGIEGHPQMKRFLVAALLAASAHASGDDIEWVTVGDPGNPPDKTGYGAVSYPFEISKFEVSVKQYVDFLNSVAANDPRQLWNAGSKITDKKFLFAYAWGEGPNQHCALMSCFCSWLNSRGLQSKSGPFTK